MIAVNGQTPERFKEIQSTGVFLGGELTIDRKGEIKNIQTKKTSYATVDSSSGEYMVAIKKNNDILITVKKELSSHWWIIRKYITVSGLQYGNLIYHPNFGYEIWFQRLKKQGEAKLVQTSSYKST